MTTPPDPEWQGQQPGQQQPPPSEHPPPPPPGYQQGPPPGYQQPGGTPSAEELWPGADAFKVAAPSGVPKDIQISFLMWMALAGLLVLLFILGLIGSASSGVGVGLGSNIIGLLLGLGAAYGAVMMRAGKAWGRIVAAVCGGILGLFLLIGLIALLGAIGLIGGAFGGSVVLIIIIPLLIVVVGLGLIIAGMVFMFRPAANAYLTQSQAR